MDGVSWRLMFRLCPERQQAGVEEAEACYAAAKTRDYSPRLPLCEGEDAGKSVAILAALRLSSNPTGEFELEHVPLRLNRGFSRSEG